MARDAGQESMKSIKKCEENRLENSIFFYVLLKTMLDSNWRPLWTFLARFRDIWGRFWVHLGIATDVGSQQVPNLTQLLDPKKAQEGLRRRFVVDLGRLLVDLWRKKLARKARKALKDVLKIA